MSINDLFEKIKPYYGLLLYLVVASVFFFLGRLSALEEIHTPIRILKQDNSQTADVISSLGHIITNSGNEQNSNINGVQSNVEENGEVIGSKNGKKYYYPWCGTLKLIKPENRVIFASITLARQAGYLPAANCKGLK